MHKLLIARPCGFRIEAVTMGTYLLKFGTHVAKVAPGLELHVLEAHNARIAMCRNMCIDRLQKGGMTHVYFLDPDMWPDAYCPDLTGEKDPIAKPFFDVAWPFLLDHNRHLGPAVVAAPYCGPGPDHLVHVFCKNERGQLVRVTRQQAATLRGWHRVEGVGTGQMLMDAGVFERLERPYFTDIYADREEAILAHSQDVAFCMKCRAKGIPIYVNFDCWAKHWQNSPVGRPGFESPTSQEPPLALHGNAAVPELLEVGPGDRGTP